MSNKKTPFSPVRNERVSGIIEKQIKQSIFQKQYQVGERLPSERELADVFNASRMSVREALRSLEKSRFITIKKGARGGAYIQEKGSEPVLESMKDLLQADEIGPEEFLHARLLIEPSVAAEAAQKAMPEDIKRIRELFKNTPEETKDRLPNIENEPRFHTEIAKITGNKVIVMMMEVIMDIHFYNQKNITMDDQSIKNLTKQHESIIDAIEKKDQHLAFESMKAHLMGNFLNHLKSKTKFN